MIEKLRSISKYTRKIPEKLSVQEIIIAGRKFFLARKTATQFA
ncbi:MAG: hypothetical protein ACP5O8_00210 [Candidatus Aenigmatarchaeota archaeon]